MVVDRFSGYPLVKQLHKTDTEAVIRKMTEWFNLLGWPRTMRSDGGPQYHAELDLFCSRNNIKHELSSAYNPRSNGLAEAAVKQVKLLLEKCSLGGECFESALYSWRNVPRGDGNSPVELLFGRKQRTALPTLTRHHQPIDLQEAAQKKDRTYERAKKAYNKGTTEHGPLQVGSLIFMQNQKSKRWNWPSKIVEVRPGGASFYVRGTARTDGKLYLLVRHYLKEVTGQELRKQYEDE